MNFDLSEEQGLLQETVRQFLENECPPTRLREIFESESGFEPTLWKGMVELGLGGLHVPEEYGGAGLELLDLALVAETLGYGAAPGPFLGHALAGLALALGGSAEQKKAWLPRLATGDALGSVALSEPGGLWQPGQWELAASEKIRGAREQVPYQQAEEWSVATEASLTGMKQHVPYASLADLVVVGIAGGGLALVERGAEGVEIAPVEGVDRSRRLGSIELRAAPCELLPDGAAAAPRLRDAGLVLLAADAFGGATRLLDTCVEYAKTRQQFGVTIGHFQAVKHRLADMAIEIEPSRALWWYAAHAFDHVPDRAERAASLAKAHITDRAMQIARDAVEVHGGIGFTWECDVQIWFKRIMFDRAFLGTPDVHRERAAQLAGW